MMDHKENQQVEVSQSSSEISLKELILRIKEMLSFLRKKWMIILLLIVIGAVSGFLLAKFKKPKYMGQSIFVLDEGKSGPTAIGGLAALGIDLGGSSSAGLFSGTKNILWLYSSRPLIKRALLSPVTRNGHKEHYIDWFIEESKLYPQETSKKLFLNVTDSTILNAAQNAIITECRDMIVSQYLKIKEEEGTDNMIKVNVISRDELFSKEFTETLVNTVNQFYVQSKTLKISQEVAILQQKADSVRLKMDNAMYQTASAIDAAPNANPNIQVLRVAPQRKKIDADISTTLYVEIVKSLESRRMALAQATPLIQVIDTPSLPLKVILPSPKTYAILGGFLAGLFTFVVLLIRFFYRKVMA